MTPDDSALLHGRVYDPQKAREYYLRTRHLKGRQAGVQEVAHPGAKSKVVTAKAHKKSAKEVRAEAKIRVEQLQARLDRLKNLLSDLVKQAKARSGVDTTPTKSAATKAKDAKDRAPLTTKQKHDAAKRSHASYEKNKPPTTQVKNLEADIKLVEQKIQKARAELKASIAKARKKAPAKKHGSDKSAQSKSKTEASTGRRH